MNYYTLKPDLMISALALYTLAKRLRNNVTWFYTA